jgi:spore maturation protein CgeB
MNIAMFYHSLLSDWNHGNAHFLRGVATELISRGHHVVVYEPKDSWSLKNLLEEHGREPIRQFRKIYPTLKNRRYDPKTLDIDRVLDKVQLVIVHEWNDHSLVRRIGLHHSHHRHYRLLFHDTHHRCVTDPEAMKAYDLSHYNGVLAFGNIIRDIYLSNGWTKRAWTWHEAADVRVFFPMKKSQSKKSDLVWIGNWGDNERTQEIKKFLIEPVKNLNLRARVHGVRYPASALKMLNAAGIEYAGWLANFHVPRVFSQFKVAVHIPRAPYVKSLPGIPTIRPFEAMACGIPLICSPWQDVEHLFSPGKDYLVARNGKEIKQHIKNVLNDPQLAMALSQQGRRAILTKHTCAHRVDELLEICRTLGLKVETDQKPLLSIVGGKNG